MADNDKNSVRQTRLYALLREKTNDHGFLDAVERLCELGEALSTQAYTFFPTFTRHDSTHILGVCEWMARLLDSMEGDKSACDELTAEEAALLLLAAYWHDSGMAVSLAQKKELLADMNARKGDWTLYFKKHPEDEVALADAKDDKVKDAEIGRILRNYVRERHATRCAEQLPKEEDWSEALEEHGVYREHVIAVCRSHGEWMEELSLENDNDNFDLRLCAVLLRLADLLDYDASRAPKELFRFLGLDRPETAEQKKSHEEWIKNKTGGFRAIRNRKIPYHATFTDPQTEHGVREYLDWVRSELTKCQTYLSQSEHDRWRHFLLPYQVENKSRRKGYDGGDFCVTMDQDRVLEMLTGESLYDDAGVFVRELLQNAIDAVLERRKQDASFGKNDGQITVRCWQDANGYGWFRIEDDGVGMNQHIIKDYFLKVGHSYYDSDEYRAASLHPARDTGDTPISRFGIGILSCFMTDPNNTLLEVSTKRYDADTPLRMDVHGLHGYYSLTVISKGRPGLPMDAPPYMIPAKNEMNRDTGTTICVRVDRYRLGYGAFRELLDKYLVFPEVKVTYYDEQTTEGYTYPTQKELMETVYALNNPDGTVKEHFFPLSDGLFERVRNENPHWHWKERPAFMLTLRPLNTLPDMPDISGIVVQAGFRGFAEYTESVSYEEKNYLPKANSFRVNIDFENRKIALYGVVTFGDNRLKRNAFFLLRGRTESNEAIFSFEEFLLFLNDSTKRMSPDEKKRWQLIFSAIGFGDNRTVTAFNGVATDRRDLLWREGNDFSTILLLRGKSRPTVNLARNSIITFPLDTLCALALLKNKYVNNRYYNKYKKELPRPLQPEQFALYSEKVWFDMLERHSYWNELICCQEKTLLELENDARNSGSEIVLRYSFHKSSVFQHLLLAALNRRFSVRTSRYKIYLSLRNEDKKPSQLPVSLSTTPSTIVGKGLTLTRGDLLNCYSKDHVFCKWLREQEVVLRERAPAIYYDLLHTMVLGDNADEIRIALNAALDRLSIFPGNPFGITNELYLTKADFKEPD